MSRSSLSPKLEVCVDTVSAALQAYKGGAHRLEVCQDLSIGGITPARSLIQDIQNVCDLPLAVMIRPRGGDFFYTDVEVDQMLVGISMVKELQVEAVVLGVLDSRGYVDIPLLQMLMAAARPLDVVFHRAFDECRDPISVFDQLLELGVDRLLTSGQASTAVEGILLLKELRLRANGILAVMPGAGIMPENIEKLKQGVGADFYHGSCRGASGTTTAEVVAAVVKSLAS